MAHTAAELDMDELARRELSGRQEGSALSIRVGGAQDRRDMPRGGPRRAPSAPARVARAESGDRLGGPGIGSLTGGEQREPKASSTTQNVLSVTEQLQVVAA